MKAQSTLDERLEERLQKLEAERLRRHLPPWEMQGSTRMSDLKGRMIRCFSSNDYLGLAAHPALAEAASKSAKQYGCGSGASRLLAGGGRLHQQLESALAAFKQAEAALSFSTGYATAVGTLAALASSDDIIILDKLSHASLVDGARLSGAKIRVFPHNDLDRLDHHLRWARQTHPKSGIFIVTESIFSMDGDVCPLREIVMLKNQYGAWILLDEAHALGVRGSMGRGLAHEVGLSSEIDIQLGTLGKALGSSGGFIAGNRTLIDFLINRARSFIYSTAPAPMTMAASLAALDILHSSEGMDRMEKLTAHRHRFAQAMGIVQNESAIFPILLGDEQCAVTVSRALLDQGIYAPAIRFPTVARNAARLRISLSAAHTEKDLEALIQVLEEVRR